MHTKLHWIPLEPPGRLAIMPRPRGADWLEDEVRHWRDEGIDVLISLLTADEVAELDLQREEKLCHASGIQYRSYPIPDRSVPSSHDAIRKFLASIGQCLNAGMNVLVHCRQGIGRAGLIAVALLVQRGIEPTIALERVSLARGCPVPETPEQARWIGEFAQQPIAS